MNPPRQRNGVMTLKQVGRAFWIGLALSLALHVFLIASGRFQIPRWDEPQELQVRLEDMPAAPVPMADMPRPAIPPAPPQTVPQPLQAADAAPRPQPEEPVAPTDPAPATPAPSPAPTLTEPVLPLSTAKTPPPSAQPYAALTRAAESIRQLPAYIEIVYELKGLLSGRQTHVWQRSGQRYSLETEGEVTGLAGLFISGKLIQKSRGSIGPLGLMPEEYEMQRLTGKKEALQFDYRSNLILSSRSSDKSGTRTLELPLLTGAQDPLSAIYQLAMAARDEGDGLIVAAGTKRVKGYPYHTHGIEVLKTPLGEIRALHVTRAGDSEKSASHLWLSPDQHALPVKVVYFDDDGTEWVLEAVSIKTR